MQLLSLFKMENAVSSEVSTFPDGYGVPGSVGMEALDLAVRAGCEGGHLFKWNSAGALKGFQERGTERISEPGGFLAGHRRRRVGGNRSPWAACASRQSCAHRSDVAGEPVGHTAEVSGCNDSARAVEFDFVPAVPGPGRGHAGKNNCGKDEADHLSSPVRAKSMQAT